MNGDYKRLFDRCGVKRVTKTDKSKGAYVPTKEQRAAIQAAGIRPAPVRPAPGFDVMVLADDRVMSVEVSYYHSERSDEADRSPEPRMGHEFVSSWLQVGDNVLIGNIGPQLFAMKLKAGAFPVEVVSREVMRRASREVIFERAKRAKGKPARRLVQRSDFVRNPWVVEAVIRRSKGRCEMPDCTCTLFETDDGTPYLEVHHVVPLAEEGEDVLANTAALCPHCHRLLHFGRTRAARRRTLSAHVGRLPTS